MTHASEWKGRAAHPAFCKSVSAHGVVWVLAGSESMCLVATVRACVLSVCGSGCLETATALNAAGGVTTTKPAAVKR